ncbi:glycoside hydrolase family 35 protein [Paenibacillus lignilyticus]|uniref:Beta-galactosidase n=1 Tax=Paenibacillus lignilyticus TaxID=1172615 RepID=A0ABS5C6D8_9BACL|nr:beta-galactosidase family protein [Paenibacillus lignilyticus]MBP3961556.1 beta-galactosidase [Paenibacillus lignilyticus]MBP3963774.1 beta-galactosidase [Paenibacillus lignilyticus]
MPILTTDKQQFLLDGELFRILSGAIHYFRVVPEYWRDRLWKLREGGFNTVETYVAWNIHEPKEGQFAFEGIADLVRFIAIAGELGLHVIVRPSPYICAEWEFGGLPAWLLADPGMRLRCYHQPFLDKVDAYYDVLLPKLVPLLSTNGGPIIAMQIENEYGSYGNDKKYLKYLEHGMKNRGIDVLLFTSDGPGDFYLQGGMVEDVLATVNFGSRVQESFDKLGEYQQDQPLMCMEYWNGWFDHWGEQHHTRDSEDAARVLDDMMAAGASVNAYMYHGGTNFGFYNGANFGEEKHQPTITSYDYDVAISESGDLTDKFYKFREVISKYVELGPLNLPEPIKKKTYGSVTLTEQAPLFASLDMLSVPVERTCPETMEQLGQDYGFILYSTRVIGPIAASRLNLQDVHDRALIFLNGEYKGTIERNNKNHDVLLDIPAEGATLDILVENMGRINYGPYMKDPKGITEGVRLGQQFLYHWTIRPLPLDDLRKLVYQESSVKQEQPTFYKSSFQVDEAADTFLALSGWTKGVVYVNGFNLGRYWEIGPQQTLYIPAPLLREGANELIIFELHGCNEPVVKLQDSAVLG